MKLLTQLLVVVILTMCLPLLPETDDCHCASLGRIPHSEQTGHDGESEHCSCHPFMECASCSGFVVSHSLDIDAPLEMQAPTDILPAPPVERISCMSYAVPRDNDVSPGEWHYIAPRFNILRGSPFIS